MKKTNGIIILFIFLTTKLYNEPYVEKNNPERTKYKGILKLFNETSILDSVPLEQQCMNTTNNIHTPLAKSINSILFLPPY